MTKTDLLIDALRCVGKGFWVFPVEPNGKTPIRIHPNRPKDEAPWTIKWSQVASNDPKKILEWWSWCPDANIGIACAPSGLLVVDCDVAKSPMNLEKTEWKHLHELFGDRVDGDLVYDQVAMKYSGNGGRGVDEAFSTYCVRTRSDGLHLFYRWPASVKASQASIVRGVLDIRCNGGDHGGYVLAPGSVIDGQRYTVERDVEIRDAMPWLVELCRDKPPPLPPLGAGADVIRQPRNHNFSGLVDIVRTAADGNLNQALFWAARAMCADGGTEAEAVDILAPVYVACGGRGGQRQAEASIRSAFRNQMKKGIR